MVEKMKLFCHRAKVGCCHVAVSLVQRRERATENVALCTVARRLGYLSVKARLVTAESHLLPYHFPCDFFNLHGCTTHSAQKSGT